MSHSNEHPSREILTDFLYDELSPTGRAEVAGHVQACGECRELLSSWRDVRGTLQRWTIADRPETAQPARSHKPVWTITKWAVAASVFITCGFALARMTAAPPSAPTLSASAMQEIRDQVKQDLSAELSRYTSAHLASQREFRRGVDRRIEKLETDRLADYSGLRKDVETVALRTQEEFVRLASTGSTGSPAESPQP
jgi:hypothetical protein